MWEILNIINTFFKNRLNWIIWSIFNIRADKRVEMTILHSFLVILLFSYHFTLL